MTLQEITRRAEDADRMYPSVYPMGEVVAGLAKIVADQATRIEALEAAAKAKQDR